LLNGGSGEVKGPQSASINAGPPQPAGPPPFVSIVSLFEVPEEEMEAFNNSMKEFYEKTRSEPGALFVESTSNGNQFRCCEGYTSAEAVFAHMQNVATTMAVASKYLKSLEFHGSRAEIDKLREPMANLKPTMFVLERDFQLNSFVELAAHEENSMISVCPYFEVPEEKVQEFRAVFPDFYNRTKTENEMLFCGFTRAGSCFSCRESYSSAQGALAHMQNVAGPMSVAGKYVKSMSIHGPQAELDKFKEANIPATYWVSTGGFSRIRRPGVPLAPRGHSADETTQTATEATAEDKVDPIPEADVAESPSESPVEGTVLPEAELQQDQTCKDASESIAEPAKIKSPQTSAPEGMFGGCFRACSCADDQLEIVENRR